MKKAEPRGEVIIRGDAKPLTPDLASRILFGLPLAELIKDIQSNPGGKYDDLLVKT
jgi:hypothetical protein